MKPVYTFIAVVLASSMLLAACGPDRDDKTPTTAPMETATAAGTMEPTGTVEGTATMDVTETPGMGTGTPSASRTPAASVTINVSQTAELGSFLVDDQGMTLYLFTEDTPGTSTCYDDCASEWPPLTTTGTAQAGTGVDASKLGTTMRTDGSTQVTYNGWPLYYFDEDEQAGDVKGQDEDNFFVVSPAGDKVDK